ncbi:hypothetical protein [Bacillus pumilus]|uniref:hypothetical protein n=1 Tax=Bacillus pumilus TaxID=1408 RepID=UPI0011A02A0A|nr:hypothetical protein [Bacillus pumilus]
MSLWNTIKHMIFKQEAKSTVNTLEKIADPPLKIDEYPKFVSEKLSMKRKMHFLNISYSMLLE